MDDSLNNLSKRLFNNHYCYRSFEMHIVFSDIEIIQYARIELTIRVNIHAVYVNYYCYKQLYTTIVRLKK